MTYPIEEIRKASDRARGLSRLGFREGSWVVETWDKFRESWMPGLPASYREAQAAREIRILTDAGILLGLTPDRAAWIAEDYAQEREAWERAVGEAVYSSRRIAEELRRATVCRGHGITYDYRGIPLTDAEAEALDKRARAIKSSYSPAGVTEALRMLKRKQKPPLVRVCVVCGAHATTNESGVCINCELPIDGGES